MGLLDMFGGAKCPGCKNKVEGKGVSVDGKKFCCPNCVKMHDEKTGKGMQHAAGKGGCCG